MKPGMRLAMRWMNSSCSRNCSAARCSSVTSCTTPMYTTMPSRERECRTRERIQRTSPSGRRQRYSTSEPSPSRQAWSNTGRSSAGMPLTARSLLSHSCRSKPAMSHRPGDHSSTVSPGPSMRRQWPACARLSMVLNTSVCSCRSRRASARALSACARAMRRFSASDTSRTLTTMQLSATRLADRSQANSSRVPSRTTWRQSRGTPRRATAHSCSTSVVWASWSNTTCASTPSSRTKPKPGIRRAAALEAQRYRPSSSRRNSSSPTGTASSNACMRPCARGPIRVSPSG